MEEQTDEDCNSFDRHHNLGAIADIYNSLGTEDMTGVFGTMAACDSVTTPQQPHLTTFPYVASSPASSGYMTDIAGSTADADQGLFAPGSETPVSEQSNAEEICYGMVGLLLLPISGAPI